MHPLPPVIPVDTTREMFRQFVFSAPGRKVPADWQWTSAAKRLSPRPASRCYTSPGRDATPPKKTSPTRIKQTEPPITPYVNINDANFTTATERSQAVHSATVRTMRHLVHVALVPAQAQTAHAGGTVSAAVASAGSQRRSPVSRPSTSGAARKGPMIGGLIRTCR